MNLNRKLVTFYLLGIGIGGGIFSCGRGGIRSKISRRRFGNSRWQMQAIIIRSFHAYRSWFDTGTLGICTLSLNGSFSCTSKVSCWRKRRVLYLQYLKRFYYVRKWIKWLFIRSVVSPTLGIFPGFSYQEWGTNRFLSKCRMFGLWCFHQCLIVLRMKGILNRLSRKKNLQYLHPHLTDKS